MWRQPVDNLYVPPGGEFLSRVLDNGAPRSLPHSGVDHSRFGGSAVYVVGPGKVVKRGTNATSGWGNYTYVDHGVVDSDGRHAYSYYAHNQQAGPALDTQFNGGERIHTIGRSGSGITGAHLHWGVAICFPAEFSAMSAMTADSRKYLVDPTAFVNARIDPLLPHERQVKPISNVNVRVDADPSAREIAEIGPGQQFTPIAYKPDGVVVHGVSLWYAVAQPVTPANPNGIGWVWGGGCTEVSGHDLPLYVPPATPVVVTPEPEPAGPGEPDIDDDPTEPEEPPVSNPTPPLVDPDLAKLENLGKVLGDEAAKWLPKATRKRVYNVVKKVGAAIASVGGVTLSAAAVVGGDIGVRMAVASAIIALVGTGVGALAAALADDNTDPASPTT